MLSAAAQTVALAVKTSTIFIDQAIGSRAARRIFSTQRVAELGAKQPPMMKIDRWRIKLPPVKWASANQTVVGEVLR